jgi:hypothetical protein
MRNPFLTLSGFLIFVLLVSGIAQWIMWYEMQGQLIDLQKTIGVIYVHMRR